MEHENNLIILIACIWFFQGFLGYGVFIGNEYQDHEIKEYFVVHKGHYLGKILFILFCMLFGLISLLVALDDGYKGLRFW